MLSANESAKGDDTPPQACLFATKESVDTWGERCRLEVAVDF
jgi:hypothetical protein